MSQFVFESRLEAPIEGAGWTMMHAPPEVCAQLGTKARVAVKGTINGFAFRSSLFPNWDGSFHMMVNKTLRDGAGAQQGDLVRVALERDEAPRTVEVPAELRAALDRDAEASARFEKMSLSHKREYADWIADAKRPETRQRRVEKAIGMIRDGKWLKG